MKRTYNLLGYLLLGISAIAFVNANNTDVIATAPATEEQTQCRSSRSKLIHYRLS
ncbi:MAG TPA: hypothetical protein V6C71_08605 [Coleofasciculaceae cyanobacterium]